MRNLFNKSNNLFAYIRYSILDYNYFMYKNIEYLLGIEHKYNVKDQKQ